MNFEHKKKLLTSAAFFYYFFFARDVDNQICCSWAQKAAHKLNENQINKERDEKKSNSTWFLSNR